MAKRGAPKGSVRIIGGQWRSRRLRVADVEGLRPSGDRLRETLFNWLTPWLPGARCVDLFAGTGALGFEAASRGAEHVVLVESDAIAACSLEDDVARLDASANVEVFRGSAEAWIRQASSTLDICFLDPPYAATGAGSKTCRLLEQSGLLAPAAKVFIECPDSQGQPEVPPSWSVMRHKRLARVAAWLFEARSIP